MLRAAILEGRVDLLRKLGRWTEAAELQAEVTALANRSYGDARTGRFAELQHAGQTLLDLQAHALAEAIVAYPAHLERWIALIDALAATGADEADAPLLAHARTGYSGDLANFGGAITTAGHWMVVAQEPPDIVTRVPVERRAAASVLPTLAEPVRALVGELAPAPLYRLARSFLEAALEISSDVPAWEFATIQAHRLISICHIGGDTSAARGYAERTVEYANHIGDHTHSRAAESWLMTHHLDDGDAEEALVHYERAALEALRGQVGLGYAEVDTTVASSMQLGMQLLDKVAEPGRVIGVIETVRAARTANAMVGKMPRGGAEAGAARAELERLRRDHDADDLAVRDRIVSLTAAIEELERKAGLRNPAFGPWVDATGLALATLTDLRDLLARSGPRSVWLTVLHFPDIGPQVDMFRSVAISSEAVSTGAWVQGKLPPGSGWSAEVAVAFGEALLGPHRHVLAGLAPDDTVIVSVPETLDGVPVSGLMLDDRPLCAQAAPVCVQGLGLFEAAAQNPARPIDHTLLLGGPDRPDQLDLPGARAEVEAIGADLRDAGRRAKVETGAAARATTVLASAGEVDALHVSCHAVRDQAGDLALLLAVDGAAGDSGWLSEQRVLADLELAPGALVDLAGCRTGAIEETSGPVLGGLVPAMLVAGARSVIASLWPIEDTAVVALQRAIYRNLIEGEAPAVALAHAQRDAWAGRLGPLLTRPAHWSAFVLYGAG
jgi:hypothetical protein